MFLRFFKKKHPNPSSKMEKDKTLGSFPIENKKPSRVEIEQALVERIQTEDMAQFQMIPFDLNCKIKKFIKPGGHPFAYIDLNKTNQLSAKEELMKINEYIIQSYDYVPGIRNKAILHVGRIVFEEYGSGYGYTRLICTPYTESGRISKSPLHLSFMTRLDNTDYQATGKLFYAIDGSVIRAEVHISQNAHTERYEGRSFYFKTVGRTFVLNEVKATNPKERFSSPETIYKFSTTS